MVFIVWVGPGFSKRTVKWVSVKCGPDGGGWRMADRKMRMIKCGWKSADGKMRMEKCGWKNADDKMMENFG